MGETNRFVTAIDVGTYVCTTTLRRRCILERFLQVLERARKGVAQNDLACFADHSARTLEGLCGRGNPVDAGISPRLAEIRELVSRTCAALGVLAIERAQDLVGVGGGVHALGPLVEQHGALFREGFERLVDIRGCLAGALRDAVPGCRAAIDEGRVHLGLDLRKAELRECVGRPRPFHRDAAYVITTMSANRTTCRRGRA